MFFQMLYRSIELLHPGPSCNR